MDVEEEDTTTATDRIDSCILQGKAQEEREDKKREERVKRTGRLVQKTDDQEHYTDQLFQSTSYYVERNLQRQTTFDYV